MTGPEDPDILRLNVLAGGKDNGNVVFRISYTGCEAQYPGKPSALFQAE